MGGRRSARGRAGVRQRAAAMAVAAALAAGLAAGVAGSRPAQAAGGPARTGRPVPGRVDSGRTGTGPAGRRPDRHGPDRHDPGRPEPGSHPPGGREPAAGPVTAPEARRAICASAAHPKLASRLARNITSAVHGRHSAVGLTVADPRLDLACRLDRAQSFLCGQRDQGDDHLGAAAKIGGRPRMTKKQRVAGLGDDHPVRATPPPTALWDEVGLRRCSASSGGRDDAHPAGLGRLGAEPRSPPRTS